MKTDERSTRRFQTLAKQIIQRDGVCSVCGTEENLSADHIVPISKGGAMWDEENLVAMCMTHNRQKSNKTVGQLTDYINPKWLEYERKQQ